MNTKRVVAITATLLAAASAQQSDVTIKLQQGERTAIAVADFRGSGDAQKFMDAFNQVLFSDLDSSGLFRMVPKSMYPLETPQRPQDFRAPRTAARGAQPVRQGPWLTDWSDPPASAAYLAFGYSGVQDGRLAVFGWLFNVVQRDVASAQVLGKMYFGSLDEAGARETAHAFAADILAQFGYKSLMGTKIFFNSTRGGSNEIWSMDPDGSNQKQVTFYKTDTWPASVSPDGTMLAYTLLTKAGWMIQLQSLLTGGKLPFYNLPGTLNVTPDFTPDGKRIVFSSNTAKEGESELYIANVNGSDFNRLTSTRNINTEPRVNPKTGNTIVFVSRPFGHAADL